MGLFLSYHIIPEDADATDLDFDDVARDHVAVRPLSAHPQHVSRVEGRVPAELLDPRRRVPDLIGRGEILPYRAVVADDDPELRRIQIGHDPGTERLERVAVLAPEHGPIAPLPLPLADVVADAVAEDVVEGALTRDVPRLLADDDR